MKKMVSINLAGKLFHINEDAYQMLSSYLEEVGKRFPGNDREEILQEIELRMAELFSEMITHKQQVINEKQVSEVIGILGDPEDYEGAAENQTREEPSGTKFNKRLYRDPDNRVLGGVCGGLGAYFNADPVLFRFLFLIVFLVFGSGLIIYLILWLITPEAVTMAQKMEMKGQKFTFEDFKQKARSEYEDVKNHFNRKKDTGDEN
jgi:phage shock protein PspC (stress-responsive transcriptional regulator)